MKTLRIGFAVLSATLMVLAYSSRPAAFHSGGVAECNGCHSMHAAKSVGGLLLVGSDQSSTCLVCHQSAGDTGPTRYHMSTPLAELPDGTAPKQMTPGGDFGWLRRDYSWSPRAGTTEHDYGYNRGHNVVAADAGYTADTANVTAPGGGAFASSKLGCQSCHDPHGRARRLSDGSYVNAIYAPGSTNAPIVRSGSYNNSAAPLAGEAVGVYRLLRAAGDNSQGVTFSAAPIAVAPATYNQSEVTNEVRVAYGNDNAGNTWGAWCGTCHPTMHSTAKTVHPVDKTMEDVYMNYNAYVKSGDLTGAQATGYTSLVPFVESTGDIAVLKSHSSNTGAYKFGASSSDQVSCVSCHRAHASGFPDMLRFSLGYEFMVYNGTYTGSAATGMGRTESELEAAYYGRKATQFASYQRVLCNKCHAKD